MYNSIYSLKETVFSDFFNNSILNIIKNLNIFTFGYIFKLLLLKRFNINILPEFEYKFPQQVFLNYLIDNFIFFTNLNLSYRLKNMIKYIIYLVFIELLFDNNINYSKYIINTLIIFIIIIYIN